MMDVSWDPKLNAYVIKVENTEDQYVLKGTMIMSGKNGRTQIEFTPVGMAILQELVKPLRQHVNAQLGIDEPEAAPVSESNEIYDAALEAAEDARYQENHSFKTLMLAHILGQMQEIHQEGDANMDTAIFDVITNKRMTEFLNEVQRMIDKSEAIEDMFKDISYVIVRDVLSRWK